jgi:putative heme-binding domain-containing protein
VFAGTDFKGGSNPHRELKTLFRPSDVAVGPDGAVYVADWFDARVGGHADWDETLSGTIYRVAPKGFKPRVPTVDLTTVDGAVEALRSTAVNVRGSAQYALLELARKDGGAAATKAVERLLKNSNPAVRARALWMLSRLGERGTKTVETYLHHPNERVRTAAFRALRRRLERQTPPDLGGLAALCARTAGSDSSPAVRREVALALRDLPAARSLDTLVKLAGGFDGQDRTYLEALGTGAWGKESALYDALVARQPKPASGTAADPLRWEKPFAWIAWRLHPAQSVAAFRSRALSAGLDESDRKRAVTAIGFNATAEAAEAMLEIAAKSTDIVKADATWWLLNRKDSIWKEFGLGEALKARGIYDPDHVELVEAVAPAAGAPKFSVADALATIGNARRGADKFKATCVSCHRVGSLGTDYAPNLTGWAKRQTLEVLLNSVVNPSADIASGFGGNEIRTKDGLVIDGLVLSNGDPVVIRSAGGVTQMVPRARVESNKGLGRSLMLSADQLGLSPQDLADIAAWLRTQ